MEDDSQEQSSSATTSGSGSNARPRARAASESNQAGPSSVNMAPVSGHGQPPPSSIPNYQGHPALHHLAFLNSLQSPSGPHPSFPHTQLPGFPHSMGPSAQLPGVSSFAAYPGSQQLHPQLQPHLTMWPYGPQQHMPFNNTLPGNPQAIQQFPHPAFSASSSRSAASPVSPVSPVASTSRSPPATGTPTAQDEDGEDQAILEDKRRRNTAASARFRIKKKQRSLNLERTVSDLSTRADELEREAANLRRENSWLKEIVIMKGRGNRAAAKQRIETRSDEEPGNSESDSSDATEEEDKGKGKGKAVSGKGKDKGGKGGRKKGKNP